MSPDEKEPVCRIRIQASIIHNYLANKPSYQYHTRYIPVNKINKKLLTIFMNGWRSIKLKKKSNSLSYLMARIQMKFGQLQPGYHFHLAKPLWNCEEISLKINVSHISAIFIYLQNPTLQSMRMGDIRKLPAFNHCCLRDMILSGQNLT